MASAAAEKARRVVFIGNIPYGEYATAKKYRQQLTPPPS